MSSEPLARCLMDEAAGLMELPRFHAYDDRPAWLVVLGDGSMLDVEYDPRTERLVFTGAIHDMQDLRRIDIYEMFLQYNYLWPETGGVRVALDGNPGQALLMVDKPVLGLGAAVLARLLQQLSAMLSAWREILGAAAAPEQADLAGLEAAAVELSVLGADGG